MKEKIVIFMMFLLNVLLCYKVWCVVNDDNPSEIKYKISVYNDSVLKSYYTNGKKIFNLSKLINIEDKRCYTLNEIIGSGSKIVFIYDINDCNMCVKNEIMKLNKLSTNVKNNLICVLLGGDNLLSYAVTFKKINKIKFPVMIVNNTNKEPLKKIIKTTPAYFLTNNDGIVINSFYTTEKGEELSNIFYQYIKEYFGHVH